MGLQTSVVGAADTRQRTISNIGVKVFVPVSWIGTILTDWPGLMLAKVSNSDIGGSGVTSNFYLKVPPVLCESVVTAKCNFCVVKRISKVIGEHPCFFVNGDVIAGISISSWVFFAFS